MNNNNTTSNNTTAATISVKTDLKRKASIDHDGLSMSAGPSTKKIPAIVEPMPPVVAEIEPEEITRKELEAAIVDEASKLEKQMVQYTTEVKLSVKNRSEREKATIAELASYSNIHGDEYMPCSYLIYERPLYTRCNLIDDFTMRLGIEFSDKTLDLKDGGIFKMFRGLKKPFFNYCDHSMEVFFPKMNIYEKYGKFLVKRTMCVKKNHTGSCPYEANEDDPCELETKVEVSDSSSFFLTGKLKARSPNKESKYVMYSVDLEDFKRVSCGNNTELSNSISLKKPYMRGFRVPYCDHSKCGAGETIEPKFANMKPQIKLCGKIEEEERFELRPDMDNLRVFVHCSDIQTNLYDGKTIYMHTWKVNALFVFESKKSSSKY